MDRVITADEVLAVLHQRGLHAHVVEFVGDPWDHVVEFIVRNERGTAVGQGVVTLKCSFTCGAISVRSEVGAVEPL